MNKSLRYGMLTATSAALLALSPGIALAAGHQNSPTVGQEANQLKSNGSTEAGTTGMNSEQQPKANTEAGNQATNEPLKNSTMLGEADNKLTGQVVKGHGSSGSATTEPSGAHPTREATNETSKSGKNDSMVGQATNRVIKGTP